MPPYCFMHNIHHTSKECAAVAAASNALAAEKLAAKKQQQRQEKAEQIAADALRALDIWPGEGREKSDRDIEDAMHSGWIDAYGIRAMLQNAALAGMEAAR